MNDFIKVNICGFEIRYAFIDSVFGYFIQKESSACITPSIKKEIEDFMLEAESFLLIRNFNRCVLQGHNWNALSPRDFYEYVEIAHNIINNSHDNFTQDNIKVAQNILKRARDELVEDSPRKRTPFEIKQRNYENKRNTLLMKLIQRDGYKCSFCLQEDVEEICIKHIIPLSKGGESELSNLELRCRKCIGKNEKSKFKQILENMDVSVPH